MKKKLISRLRILFYAELVSIFLLPTAFILYRRVDAESIGLNFIASVLTSSFLLFQGSLFWFGSIRKLNDKSFNFLHLFKTFNLINLFCFIILFMIILFVPFVSKSDKIGTIIFSILAVLEYINYYKVQLMYDSLNDVKYLFRFGRLKKSKLNSALTTL
jgi:hypothetical protein